MAVRRGTRWLLASLRATGAKVRVVTANLMGVEAVRALAASEAEFGREKRKGWTEIEDVTVVVDRAPGTKKLPDDVVRALKASTDSRCVILDDNPTAWEATAAKHVWVVPQFDVRRPMSKAELHDELQLLPRISDKCAHHFAVRPTVTSPRNGPGPNRPPAPRPSINDILR